MTENNETRALALKVLGRIERDSAFANLALRAALDDSELDERDKALVTELVYGVTRMRRACDFLIDRFISKKLHPDVRTILRLGTYQLHWMNIPDHAAVNASVSLAPKWATGLCNAVLRKVAKETIDWPTKAIEYSYPDWIVERLESDLGEAEAGEALKCMNSSKSATHREDGYFQDAASQMVSNLLTQEGNWGEGPVIDVCAAPGGKASAAVSAGFPVIAADSSFKRLKLARSNSQKLNIKLPLVVSDGIDLPFRQGEASRVIVDAPCSGLGVLRRRADARWRIKEEDIDVLADLQLKLLCSAFTMVKPGGLLIYSVCTLTNSETIRVDEKFRNLVNVEGVDDLPHPWREHGRGGMILPQDLDSEGMSVFCYRVP
ncbi:MAG: transcription antitermination factor NusB [Acidimicrobiales bacterium]|jgi:16S rRNA (cytosine967-C5)-methyltransferase|nr:transcription antitermination factor NusB [Acidimicrobiales bacterium]MDP6893819.1 transcription antitermination factor NusB [Acidimicrobiales bacterium]HJM37886.1 transcription antitermination factor NusB [Acidimicrobiales bacterium]